MSVSLHHLQIVREVKRHNDMVIATFLTRGSEEVLCMAWYVPPDLKKIQAMGDWLSIERASAVSIAIGMAIEWLTEQGNV